MSEFNYKKLLEAFNNVSTDMNGFYNELRPLVRSYDQNKNQDVLQSDILSIVSAMPTEERFYAYKWVHQHTSDPALKNKIVQDVYTAIPDFPAEQRFYAYQWVKMCTLNGNLKKQAIQGAYISVPDLPAEHQYKAYYWVHDETRGWNDQTMADLNDKASEGIDNAIAKLHTTQQYGVYRWVSMYTADDALKAKAEAKMNKIKEAEEAQKQKPVISREEFFAELAKINSPAPV